MAMAYRPTLAPDINRPIEWDALNARFDTEEAVERKAIRRSRPMFLTVAEERGTNNCNAVQTFINGEQVCGFQRCATCGHNKKEN